MTTDSRELFTAAEIGDAIRKTRQSVHRVLQSIPPSGKKVVGNNLANAWCIAALPPEITATLRELRERYCYPTIAAILADPPKTWRPALPLAQVSEADLQNAQRLQRALARAVAQSDHVAVAERARMSADDYAREFGEPASEGHRRALITRTLDRDGGERRFDRIELYLSDRPQPRDKTKAKRPRPAVAVVEFPELAAQFAAITDAANPTPADVAFCWRRIVEFFSEQVAGGTDEQTLKRQLRGWLPKAAPFLSENDQALKRSLNRNLHRAATDGLAAIKPASGRTAKETAERIPDHKHNLQLLKEHTKTRQGVVSQAWRELHLGTAPLGKQFTAAFREYFPFDPREAKSQVPAIMRGAARQGFILAQPLLLGGRIQHNRQASFQQDWSEVHANDVHTADDVTADVYVYQWAENGAFEFGGRRFDAGRPQMIPMICDRTDFPLGIVTELVRQPNSSHVHRVVTETWLNPEIGLPHCGAKFERGAFDALKVRGLFAWPEIDERFAQAGIHLRLHQVRGPKGKSAIERYAGMLHRQLNHLPAYCGNEERVTCPAKLRKFLDSLRRIENPLKAEVDPREMLRSMEEFRIELKRAMHGLANEVQNGARLRGRSPAEAWKELAAPQPARVLPDSLRYLLATQRFTRTVTTDGIALPVSKWDKRVYFGGDRLGEMIGQKVEVYLNPDLPGHIICIHRGSDPRGLDPFSVPLFTPLPANNATKEDFARARAHRRDFLAPSRAEYTAFTPPSSLTLRNERLASPDTHERGEKIEALQREQIDLGKSRARHRKEIEERGSAYGLDPNKVNNPAETVSRLRRANELFEKARQREAEKGAAAKASGVESGKKTYVLECASGGEIINAREAAIYWSAWGRLSKVRPDLDRHAVTRRVLGANVPHKKLTRAQWGKLLSAFRSIAHEARIETAAPCARDKQPTL